MFRIFVSPSAKQAVERFAAAFDMKEQGVANRVYQRFGTLPLDVQKWFVGIVDAHEGEGLKRFAQSLTDAATKKGPVFDVDLMDDQGNSKDESPDQSPSAAKRKGRGKKP